jgi:hypothetical protein
LELSFDEEAKEEKELAIIKEEIKNTNKAIEENELIKQRMTKKLEKNQKKKKICHNLLLYLAGLINNKEGKQKREIKEGAESTNPQDKNENEGDVAKMQRELEVLRKQLKEKEDKIQNLEKAKEQEDQEIKVIEGINF